MIVFHRGLVHALDFGLMREYDAQLIARLSPITEVNGPRTRVIPIRNWALIWFFELSICVTVRRSWSVHWPTKWAFLLLVAFRGEKKTVVNVLSIFVLCKQLDFFLFDDWCCCLCHLLSSSLFHIWEIAGSDGKHAGPAKLFGGDGRLWSCCYGPAYWPDLGCSSLPSGERIITWQSAFQFQIWRHHFAFKWFNGRCHVDFQVAEPVLVNSSPVSDQYPIPRFAVPTLTASRRQDGPWPSSGFNNNLQVTPL